MHDCDKEGKLSGHIKIDDAYLGDNRTGNPGRGSEQKFHFVTMVQTNGGNSILLSNSLSSITALFGATISNLCLHGSGRSPPGHRPCLAGLKMAEIYT